jgi:kinetochore protein Spc7/SPC105
MNIQLQQLKDHARLQSKKIWYDWRTQLTENLLHELNIRLQNMLNDKENLTTDLVKVDELRTISKERLESLRNRMDHVKQLKQKLSGLDKDELLRIKESLLKAGSELLSLKNDLENKNKQFEDMSSKIRQKSLQHEHLQREISECKKILSRHRNYSREEIALLTLRFNFLQQYSKLVFISMNDKIMVFEYDKTFKVSFNFGDFSDPHSLTVSVITNEGTKAENGRGYVVKHKFLEELTISILKKEKASKMIDKFQVFVKIWKQAKQFDKDIFKIGLICPVSFDLKDSTLKVSFSYCNFVKDYKLQVSCELELEQLLDYLNKISIELDLLRGCSISKSMIENDLKSDVPKTGILSETNIKQLVLNRNMYNGVN